jgi:hypothetical protein
MSVVALERAPQVPGNPLAGTNCGSLLYRKQVDETSAASGV